MVGEFVRLDDHDSDGLPKLIRRENDGILAGDSLPRNIEVGPANSFRDLGRA